MKNIQKIFLFGFLLLASLLLSPTFSKAATTVSTEDDLITAITNAGQNDVIELGADIQLTKPLGITNKTITIDGKGHTVSKSPVSWTPDGSNATLITAGLSGTKLTLKNMVLKDSQKYGVQSYDGAYVILDGITISNCAFGGVLVNAGTVEVRDLNLYRNGGTSNNGIEIAKGNGIYASDNDPKLVMNGSLKSTETENVIYLAINDQLSDFEVENTETSENKIFAQGNTVVVTDKNNNILYTSNENSKAKIEGETFVENVIVTIQLNEQSITMSVIPQTVLTSEQVTEKINLETLGLSNYTLDGFFADPEFKTAFDFNTPITANTTIYTKLKLKETTTPSTTDNKDTTPKTGVTNYVGLALFVMAVSTISLVNLRKKEF